MVGIGIAIMENNMDVPQQVKKKKKIELPYDSAIPFLGIEIKISMRYLYTHIHCSITYNNQTKCPLMDKWIKKMWNKYIMEHFSFMKKRKSCHL